MKFSGNIVLNEDVYRAVLDLPDYAGVDRPTAIYIARRLSRFLHRAGYELALVRTDVAGDHIDVFIEEGQLDRIIFPMQNTLGLLRLRLEIDLPDRVFNRPHLERQLAEFAARHGYSTPTLKLTRVEDVDHRGVQLPSDLPKMPGVDLLPDPRPYQLQVFLEKTEWRTGLGLDLALRSPDGLILGVKYRGVDLVLDDDRWEVRGNTSVRIQDVIGESTSRRFLSGGGGEFKWYTPPLFGTSLRPQLWLRAQYLSFQRLDLGIDNYDLLVFDPAVTLSSSFGPEVQMSLGGGVDYRILAIVDELADPLPRIDPRETPRLFLTASAELLFGSDVVRANRRHKLDFEARHYGRGSIQSFTRLEYEYQCVFEFGFDEFWLLSEGQATYGDVAFTDQIRVSQFVRGISSDDLFAKRAINLAAQYRLSLARDLYKVSIVADVAAFDQRRLPTDANQLRVATSVGAGFHALIIESFQLDLYLVAGFTSKGEEDVTFTAAMKQAF